MSSSETESSSQHSGGLDLAYWLKLFNEAGPQLMRLLGLQGQLFYLEWQQEKRRLQWLLVAYALACGFVLLALIFTTVAILYLSRNTEIFSVLLWLFPLLFVLGAFACLLWGQRLSRQGQFAFGVSQSECARNIQVLLRGKA
jgi:uncharacterized membrane protein YqjE